MLLHYFRTALRNLVVHKGQTLICALGLSIGILVFSISSYLTTMITEVNRQFPNYEQMAKLVPVTKNGGKWYKYPYTEVKKLEEARLPEIQRFVYGSKTEKQTCSFLSSDSEKEAVFEVFCTHINAGIPEYYSMQLVAGNMDGAFIQPHSLLLTESVAQKIYGGNNQAIGQKVKYKKELYTILGVVKELSRPNHLTGVQISELFFCYTEEEMLNVEGTVSLLLQPGTDLKELNRKIAGIGTLFSNEKTDKTSGSDNGTYHFEVERINADKEGTQGFTEKILLQSFGFLILLSGLINFFSLSIGSFYNRTRELSMRKSIGATDIHLFGQLFTEQVLTLLLASFFALCLCETVLPWSMRLLDSVNTMGFYLDMPKLFGEMLVILMELLIASAIIVGITILRIHRIPAMRGMRGGNTTGNKHRVRNILLGVEFSICLLFFGAAGMLYMQNNQIDASIFSSSPKEEQERTFIVPLTAEQLTGMEQEVIKRLTENTLVTDYLLTENTSLNDSHNINATITNSRGREFITIMKVSTHFPEFTHTKLLQGKFPENNNQIVVSKSVSELMEKDKMGNRLSLDNKDYIVCGIIEDIELSFVHNEKDKFVIMPADHPKYCYLRCQSGKEKELLKHIDQVMRQWIPATVPLHIDTFYENLNETLLLLQIMQHIFFAFALMCIFITILGIYAAITLDTEKRRKEVAIRKVNGASFNNIILLFSRLYVRIFCIATVFGVPILWIIATTLQMDFREKYNFNNPLFWLCLLLATACIIIATISAKLYRIAHINPAETIKDI